MKYLISYDISDPKKLRKVAKYLEDNGIRAQRSLFELEISTKKANQIFEKISELIDETTDKCFMLKVSNKEDLQGSTSIERII